MKDKKVSKSKDLEKSKFNKKSKVSSFTARKGKDSKYDEDDRESGRSVRPYNDPEWWLKYPELAKNAGNFWFSDPIGKLIGESDGRGSYSKNNDATRQFEFKLNSLPTAGVVGLEFVPTFGVTGIIRSTGYENYDKSAIGIAANHLYWDIVHANSRNISYDQNDLMMLLIAMDNIYSMIADAVRTYGLLRQFSVTNRYICKAVVKACGWDYENVRNNLAQFRYSINRVIMLANRIHIPRVYNIFAAHVANFTRVFADQEDVKAQLFVLKTTGYYRFRDELATIKWVPYTTSTDDQAWNNPKDCIVKEKDINYISVIEDRIMEVLNSTYMGVMDGDILKRFGEEAMFKMPEISEDYGCPIVYDKEFNLKLRNANFCGKTGLYCGVDSVITHPTESASEIQATLNIYPINNNIDKLYNQKHAGSIIFSEKNVLSVPDDLPPSPDVIMLMTRWMSLGRITGDVGSTDANRVHVEVDACGTEVLIKAVLYYFNGSYDLRSIETDGILSVVSSAVDTETLTISAVDGMLEEIKDVMCFVQQSKVRFPMYLGRAQATEHSTLLTTYLTMYFERFTQSIDNYATISSEDLERLHYVAVVSIFERVDASPFGFAVSNG